MSNTYFQFKQFTIHHDRCAMKVGTDGVLLGAWAPVQSCQHILDVGTGTGLIALQLAQRTLEAAIDAIEIDESAAQQASENVANSPWSEKIHVICQDYQHYLPSKKYDLIVSNPPYFVDALKCPDKQRNAARHADGLSYESLFRHSLPLLQANGVIAVILPAELETHIMNASGIHGFYRYHRLRVFSKPNKPCRRLLLLFGLDPLHSFKDEILYITDEIGNYTPEYRALTGDFYLKM